MKTANSIYYGKLSLLHVIQLSRLKAITFLILLVFSKPGISVKASVNDTISHWSFLMAERLMDNPSVASGPNLQSYVFATGMKGLRELFEATGDSVLYRYISDIVDENLSDYEALPGISVPDMDYINGASLIEFMYSRTGDDRYIPAIDSTLKYLYAMPRTADGGIYHKGGRSYYRLQLDDYI